MEISTSSAFELTDEELQQLKEQNQQRVKRVVALVAVVITVIRRRNRTIWRGVGIGEQSLHMHLFIEIS